MTEEVLRLTSPHMRGSLVRKVQRFLHVPVDGEYGPVTGSAAAAWKYRAGFPEDRINTGLGEDAQAYLFGEKKLPRDYRRRARARAKRGYYAGHGLPQVAVQAKTLLRAEACANAKLKEDPSGSNVVPALVDEGKRLGVPSYRMGYAWCAYFAMLCALASGSKTAAAGLVRGEFNALYVPEILALAQAGRFGMRVVSRSQAQPGDFVIFNWDGGVADHIGLLRETGAVEDRTVEGNTSYDNTGSQSNGGAVALRERPHRTIQAYIRYS
jgi:hypothetical protein